MINLSRVKILDMHQQDLWTVFLVTYNQLTKVHGSCNLESSSIIDPHPVDISVVDDSLHMLGARFNGVEAHSLTPSIV